ncbi:hypothetical protein [Streptomyces sp. NPDC096311]|uniref:hypothetical protein n=1 Tax=Streptomyces sp. NPDC096311 TaxID=3366083 RepID=UPI003817915C
MSPKREVRERLLDLISKAEAANCGTTPEAVVDEAIHEALLNQPVLHTCLFPGCIRQHDARASLAGEPASRPSWSSAGWRKVTRGPGHGDICPDHAPVVTKHLPNRLKLPNGRWGITCACEWITPPQRHHPVLRALWEQHLLEVTGALPAAPPVTDSEHRIPLAEHTDATLTELYDRLWNAEDAYQEYRDVARACMVAYTIAVPALLGAKTALEALRTRITLDSRDWAHDKLDALLYAVIIGWNCENTDPDHQHNPIDCPSDQGLWDIARKHDIPTDQTIQAGNHRWWIANAIKAAQQIEEQAAKQQEVN